MDRNYKEKSFFPPVPPEDAEDTAFDITSVASATECTGIGHVFPIQPGEPDDLIEKLPDIER